MKVTWTAKGNVKEAVVVKSSGNRILDENTTNYIKVNWRSLTGKEATHTVTEQYRLH